MATMLISLVVGIGGSLLSKLFAPKPKDIYGPRMSDLNVPAVSPGNMIPRTWGTMKMPCQMVWNSRLIETTHVIDPQSQSGGKGGAGGGGGKGGGQKQYSYTYSVHAAWLVCEGQVAQVNRIWANQKMLWENPALKADDQYTFDDAYYAELDRQINEAYQADVDEAYASAFIFAFNNYRPDEYTYGTQMEAAQYIAAHPGSSRPADQGGPIPNCPAPNYYDVNNILGQMLAGLGHDEQYASNRVRFDEIFIYLGEEEQLPNSLYASYVGPANAVPFRGVCYFVINNLQLSDFGNAIPTMTCEVMKEDGEIKIATIIADVCAEAGLTSDQVFVEGSIPITAVVDGFAITQPSTARDTIAMLMKVFPFDACESGYRLRFNWINQRPVARLRREDFAAHIDSDQLPIAEQVTRLHDWDLPRRLNLKFQEKVRAFSSNTAFAIREVTQAQTIDDIDFTGALTSAQAKTQVEEMLALRFTGRQSYKVYLPRKYAILEPGDAVFIPDRDFPNDRTMDYAVRLLEINIGVNGICECTFATHNFHVDVAAITAAVLDTSGDMNASQIAPPKSSATTAFLYDMPLLTDDEPDNIGFYAVLQGASQAWPGGFLAVDLANPGQVAAFGAENDLELSGSSYYTVTTNKVGGISGYVLKAMPPGQYGAWDMQSVITVYVRNAGAQILSATKNDVLTLGTNLIAIGQEIVQFLTAKNLGNQTWQLSGFLRGLRGTERFMNTHTDGEAFCNLNRAIVQRVPIKPSFVGQTGTFKALTMGDDLSMAAPFTFTPRAVSLMPRAPQIVSKQTYLAGTSLFMRWRPRNRQNGGLYSGVAVTPDQDFERYEIDISRTNWPVFDGPLQTFKPPDGSRSISGADLSLAAFQASVATLALLNKASTAQLAASAAPGAYPAHPVYRIDLYQISSRTLARGFVSSITLQG